MVARGLPGATIGAGKAHLTPGQAAVALVG